MTYAEFQDRWEQEAERERRAYDAQPVSALLNDIEQGSYGQYYQIWSSLGARARLEEVRWRLFDLLSSNADYLVRNHCAEALIAIAGLDLQPEHLSARGVHPVDQHLATVARLLEARLGPRP